MVRVLCRFANRVFKDSGQGKLTMMSYAFELSSTAGLRRLLAGLRTDESAIFVYKASPYLG